VTATAKSRASFCHGTLSVTRRLLQRRPLPEIVLQGLDSHTHQVKTAAVQVSDKVGQACPFSNSIPSPRAGSIENVDRSMRGVCGGNPLWARSSLTIHVRLSTAKRFVFA